MKKYGKDAFDVSVLATEYSAESLNAKEIFFIGKFKSSERNFGFNLRGGGSFGKHSDESKKRMSEAVSAAYATTDLRAKRSLQNLGKTYDAERRANISKSLMGKTVSESAKLSMSKAAKLLWSDPAYSDKTRPAITAALQADGCREKTANSIKNLWLDDTYREMMLAARKATQEKGNAARKAVWADPVRRAARLEKLKATIAKARSAQI